VSVDVDRFLGRLVGPIYVTLSSDPALSMRLTALTERAVAAWPGVKFDENRFIEHLGDRIAPDAPADILERLYTDDIYLAAACSTGDAAALAACERAFTADIEHALAAVRLPASMRDEVWSRLRARVFVATPDAPPAIAAFTGRGSLKKWLRVAATRLALNEMRDHQRESPLSERDLPEAADDLQLGHLKRTYQHAFKQAFSEAIADLTAEQRTLLRMHLLDKLSIDDLARLHRVHRTSTARWLREAREVLANGTRQRLHASLGVKDDDLDSIMNVVRSRLDLSLSRLFAAENPEP
jgi:RNA polymerase sigma-70 factor (ECF subfamily)